MRADQSYSILTRIVQAAGIDTILHTFLTVDSTRIRGRALHEQNVIGTMNLLAAAGSPGSAVRQVIVKSSTLVYGSSWQDPTWFREEMPRVGPARSRVERSLVEVESYVRDFAEDNPHVTVTAAALRQRARHRHRDADHPRPSAAPRAVHLRLRPVAAVRRGGRRRAIDRVRHHPSHPRHLQCRGGRSGPVERGGRHVRQASGADAADRHRMGGRRLSASSASSCPPSCCSSSATAAAPTTADSRPPASSTATRRPGPWRASPAPSVCSARWAFARRYRYEQDVEQFFRHSSAVVRTPEGNVT